MSYPLLNPSGLELDEWLKINCLSNLPHHNASPWNIVFPMVIWNLWKHRNRVMYENAPLNPNLHVVCLSQATEFFFCISKIRPLKYKSTITVKWIKPPEGWHKLNTDDASFGNPGKAGGGGIIRDSEGK